MICLQLSYLSSETLAQLVELCSQSILLEGTGWDPNNLSYFLSAPSQILTGKKNPWTQLEAITLHFKQNKNNTEQKYKFLGGLAGYLDYECYQSLYPWAQKLADPTSPPNYWFGLYDFVVASDHLKKQTVLYSVELPKEKLEKKRENILELLQKVSKIENQPVVKKITVPDFEFYKKQVLQIKDYLNAGDIYQLNLTHPFVVELENEPSSSLIYQQLSRDSEIPYRAFINTGTEQIISLSPENLIKIDGKKISTSPIKGTILRRKNSADDEQQKEKLKTDEKFRAELLMIIDLERNDLGTICKVGSITANPLFEVQTWPHLHHLSAKIEGTLRTDVHSAQALKALFPGGSVTGAPKKRAIELIHKIETSTQGEYIPRHVYTGALGFFNLNGDACFNLPIRTFVLKKNEVHYHAGGAIVIDSDPRAEYDEMFLKARTFLDLFKT